MYVPNHFKEDDQEKLQQYIRGYSSTFAVTASETRQLNTRRA